MPSVPSPGLPRSTGVVPMNSVRSMLALAIVLISIAAAFPGTVAQAQDSREEATFPAEVIREDFRHLYETLRAAHFDLYAYRSREAYDEFYRELLASIDAPMDRAEVVRLFTPFVTFGQIGHARIDFPVQEYIEYALSGGTLLPLDIRVEDGRTLITHNYSGVPALAPGTELVSINGRDAVEWIERIGRLVSAERPYMTHAQLESMFPRLVWLAAGEIQDFEIVVREGDGNEAAITVDAVPVMSVEEQKGTREALQHSRKAEMLADDVAYLRPGPFYAAAEGETLEAFEAFIDAAFRRFIASGAQDLVIDLRNNPGGDNSFSDPMIAWIADKPFRFASQFVVKASARTREVLRGLAEQYPGGISAQMLEAMKQHEDGDTFAFEIPQVQPRNPAFTGRTWVLVNRHSYSNATSAAAIIQDYGFGTLLGEETSDLPTSYASSAQFTLPETGIVVTYPKAYFVRPSGDEALRGVVPNHALEFPVVPAGEDVVLRDALRRVLAERP